MQQKAEGRRHATEGILDQHALNDTRGEHWNIYVCKDEHTTLSLSLSLSLCVCVCVCVYVCVCVCVWIDGWMD